MSNLISVNKAHLLFLWTSPILMTQWHLRLLWWLFRTKSGKLASRTRRYWIKIRDSGGKEIDIDQNMKRSRKGWITPAILCSTRAFSRTLIILTLKDSNIKTRIWWIRKIAYFVKSNPWLGKQLKVIHCWRENVNN